MWKRPWLIGAVLGAVIVSCNRLPSFAQAGEADAATEQPSAVQTGPIRVRTAGEAVPFHIPPRRPNTQNIKTAQPIPVRTAGEPIFSRGPESPVVAGRVRPSNAPLAQLGPPGAGEDPFGPAASESQDDDPFGVLEPPAPPPDPSDDDPFGDDPFGDNPFADDPFAEKKPDAGKVLRALGEALQMDFAPYEDQWEPEVDPDPVRERRRRRKTGRLEGLGTLEDDPFGGLEWSKDDGFGSPPVLFGRGKIKSPKRHVPAMASSKLRSGGKAIEKALDQPTRLEFIETPLYDVVDYLRERHGIQIMVDHRALDMVGIPSDTPITVNIRKLPLRSALDLMLREFDLTWTVHCDVLLITTPEEAETMMITKVYDVADLVVCRDKKGRLWDDYDTLIEVLQTTVDPMNWDIVGGSGSADGGTFSTAKVLVVSQTYRTHQQIAALLKKLRRVARKHPGKRKPPLRKRPPPAPPIFKGGVPVVG